MRKKIIIIGAGVSGLTAGIYAQQSGFDTTIFEQHTMCGGLSTSWKRNGYYFEGGMHFLTGAKEGSDLNRIWSEVGALDGTEIRFDDPALTVLQADRRDVKLYRNLEQLRDHLLDIAPEDRKLVLSLYQDAVLFAGADVPVTDIRGVKVTRKSGMSLAMLGRYMKLGPRMATLNQLSADEYVKQFQNGAVRLLLGNLAPHGFPASAMFFMLGARARGDCGYPQGGSIRMTQKMAKKYQTCGGKIQYQTQAERVLVRDNRAVGVVIGGEEICADAVIVALDARTAIDRLFETPLQEAWCKEMRDTLGLVACTFVSLGIEADLSAYPETLLFVPQTPLVLAGEKIDCMGINNYAAYGYAPAGCTAATSVIMTDSYDDWKEAKADGSYSLKKEQLAQDVIARVEAALPETTGRIKVWDVATPLTYERYCGSFRGSWMNAMRPGEKQRNYRCKAQTIDHLYFAGQRMHASSGLPGAVLAGREAAQWLCKDEDARFVAGE